MGGAKMCSMREDESSNMQPGKGYLKIRGSEGILKEHGRRKEKRQINIKLKWASAMHGHGYYLPEHIQI
jgi:hypothetical protein